MADITIKIEHHKLTDGSKVTNIDIQDGACHITVHPKDDGAANFFVDAFAWDILDSVDVVDLREEV